MANNITMTDLVDKHDLNQSFLLNEYVHNKIRVPLETLFNQGDQVPAEKKPKVLVQLKRKNFETYHSDIQSIWSIKVGSVLDQIMLLSESTKQKTIGFIGDSGSGKSSLINSILDYELLPTDYEETCTASATTISSWKELYYQLFVYFISEEQWKLESSNARETIDIFKNDKENELPDDVKAFMLKQKYLFKSNSVDETPLDSLPKDVKEKMIKSYEIYETRELEKLKEQLIDFSCKNGRLWPIVDKIYIRGPFTKLNSDIMLLDIPGYGDGYEAMTIQAAEAAAICDQLVHVVRGDGRAPLTPNFLKNLLRSSTSLKHLSVVITHRNIVVQQAKKQKENYETIEQQYREKLKKTACDIQLDNFSIEYKHRFISDLPVYYVENRFAYDDWSEADHNFLNTFASKELNNVVEKELDQTRFDIINKINTLLKFLSVDLEQPLCEVIRNEELYSLTDKCLKAFSPEIERITLNLGHECKKLWNERFWPLLKKANHNISPERYDNLNYQTFRSNLTGKKYMQISSELSSGVIDESKIETLPTTISLLTNVVCIDELQVIFSENLFSPLKDIFKAKNAERLYGIVDQYANKIQYHVKKLKNSIDFQLQSIRGRVKYSMDLVMKDEIRNRLWIADGLCHVTGRKILSKYRTSLQKFIKELNTIDLNLEEKLYKRLSPYFKEISNAFISFKNDINATISGMNFIFSLDDKLKEKVLKVLVPLPLQFIPANVENVDQPPQQDIAELQDYPLPALTQTQITEQHWTLSNIHMYNHEILAPIPTVYTDISTNYVYYGYVYVFSNEAIPNLYKIGYTTVGSYKRAKQLYTTGVPLPFFIEKTFTCHNCKLFEQWMHILFIKHRINTGREFFRVPLQIIIDVGNKLEIIMAETFRNG